jgi:hypothetical protein
LFIFQPGIEQGAAILQAKKKEKYNMRKNLGLQIKLREYLLYIAKACRHVGPLLGNDHKISSYTTTVAR